MVKVKSITSGLWALLSEQCLKINIKFSICCKSTSFLWIPISAKVHRKYRNNVEICNHHCYWVLLHVKCWCPQEIVRLHHNAQDSRSMRDTWEVCNNSTTNLCHLHCASSSQGSVWCGSVVPLELSVHSQSLPNIEPTCMCNISKIKTLIITYHHITSLYTIYWYKAQLNYL